VVYIIICIDSFIIVLNVLCFFHIPPTNQHLKHGIKHITGLLFQPLLSFSSTPWVKINLQEIQVHILVYQEINPKQLKRPPTICKSFLTISHNFRQNFIQLRIINLFWRPLTGIPAIRTIPRFFQKGQILKQLIQHQHRSFFHVLCFIGLDT